MYVTGDIPKDPLMKGKLPQVTIQFLVILIGIASSITLMISALSVHRKRLIIFAMVTSSLVGLQYGLTGTLVGLGACLIGITRSSMVLGSFNKPWLNHWLFIPVFMGLHVVSFSLFTDWSQMSVVTFVPLVAAWLGVISVFFKKVHFIKVFVIAAGSLWFVYEWQSGVYGQMVGEAANIIFNIVALTILLKAEAKGISENDVEDVDTQVIRTITSSIPVIKAHVEKELTGSIRVISEQEATRS